ncbi:unnamed protein product (mitochondrion) [Plasmodiophora brassicae]|uniref:F-box domain-containing protein n=1 Tax=Plasmodiophora brassicae TaxID=37360 RepID=A0A3P3YKV7_PLABS|nr:unnamed protein product [Plasmodiophora brassicae]
MHEVRRAACERLCALSAPTDRAGLLALPPELLDECALCLFGSSLPSLARSCHRLRQAAINAVKRKARRLVARSPPTGALEVCLFRQPFQSCAVLDRAFAQVALDAVPTVLHGVDDRDGVIHLCAMLGWNGFVAELIDRQPDLLYAPGQFGMPPLNRLLNNEQMPMKAKLLTMASLLAATMARPYDDGARRVLQSAFHILNRKIGDHPGDHAYHRAMSLLIESVPEHDREAVLNTPDEFGEYAVCRLLRLREAASSRSAKRSMLGISKLLIRQGAHLLKCGDLDDIPNDVFSEIIHVSRDRNNVKACL